MLNLTGLARPWFARKVRASHAWADRSGMEASQEATLGRLLARAKGTETGRKYGFGGISSYEEFKRRVPVVEYPEIRHDVERMVAGEKNVLWPGRCRRFAQSSGTSDGKSKYIPITDDSLKYNHYAGATYSVAFYLDQVADSRIFGGKSLILGGSFANEISGLPRGVKVGDLSASLIDRINPGVNLFRVPSKEIALMSDWTEKLPAIVKSAMSEDVTNISGVPSWFLTVLKKVVEESGADTIHDVWPNLEVFFHGGISFAPYREQYDRITDVSKMHYLENYNASEGFFAAQDSFDERGMRLLGDVGVFYEFIPLESVGEAYPESYGAWEVEPGHTYALIISSCNGLWRYAIGDTVTVESVDPLRISVAGRTKCFINAFGEELMVHNAEAAMSAACKATGAHVADYTAGPVYAGGGERGHHRWLIEWDVRPKDMDEFARELDRCLQSENSDYQAKRSGEIFLAAPEVVSVEKSTFERWLASTGKLGGQRKVPRLSNTPDLMNKILNVKTQKNV